MVKKFVIGKEYQGVFLKPKFGDASGVLMLFITILVFLSLIILTIELNFI